MKKMTSSFFSVICLLYFSTAENNLANAQTASGYSIPDSVKQSLDQLVRHLASADSCRVMVKIVHNNQAYYSGYDGRKSRVITDFSNPVEIGSCSKLFTAAAIHQLIEQKKLSLDTRLKDILPNPSLYKDLLVIDGVDYTDSIRIVNLLNHTSGLADYFLEEEKTEIAVHGDSTLRYTPTQLITLSKRLKIPGFKTNSSWKYSNVNYILLGMIIEKITGLKYQQYIQDNILQPLALKHTYFGSVNQPKNRVAGFWKKQPSELPATFAWAAGEMIATLDDMTKFIDAWYLGKIFIHKSTLKALQNDNMRDMGMNIMYGMGIINLRGKSWGHAGETFGASTFVAALPNNSRFALAIDDANVSNWLPAITISAFLSELKN